MADLLGLQSQLADSRPQEAIRDAWVWRQPRFSAKATYHLLCGQIPPEDSHIIQRCILVWKRRIPLKIRIFGWLLLRQRLMTRVVHQRMLPARPVSCPLCDGGPEDCSHLFFQCPLAQEAWRVVGAAYAPRTMYPCYDKPRCLFSLTQWNLGAPFGVLPSLISKIK